MKFSQSLVLSIPIARPGDKVPAANARVDVYCEHADRDGAAAAHMRLAEALRPVLARWLVDESKVVTLADVTPIQTDTSGKEIGIGYINGDVVLFRENQRMPSWKATWESEALRMADESGIDGDDDEVGE